MMAMFAENMMHFAMAESFSAVRLGLIALVLCVLVLITIIIRSKATA